MINRSVLSYLFDLVVALLVGFVAYSMFDNAPPQVRISGYITSHQNPARPPRLGETFDVHWKSTPHVRSCPGEVQIEIIQGNVIWPVMKRSVFNPKLGSTEFSPAPWPVPEWAKAGPAIYRVTTFWRCNWFQRLFPNWAIVQIGPDIPFTILPRKQDHGHSATPAAPHP
jgi:hypothetical protein